MATYNDSSLTYNQAGIGYNLSLTSCTATGSGVGSAVAATKVIQFRLGIHTDFTFGFTNGAGRFYIGPPTVIRTATGSGTGAGSATRKIVVVRTATGSGAGTSNTTIVRGILRTAYGSGGASTGDNAIVLVKRLRSASATGFGASSNTQSVIRVRTATGSGVGSSSSVRVRVALRTASSTGVGSGSTIRVLVAIRTGSNSGAGSSVVVGARISRRTATGSGSGSGTASWVKSHIFRVPYSTNYPGGYFGGGDAANRLQRYNRTGVRARNLYKLTNGEYTTVDQRDLGQVAKLWYGGRDHFLTDAEVAELTAAGFGANIT